jgi:hypothetical protein
MNSHVPTIDLDPAVHGALLRLLKSETQSRPKTRERALPEQRQQPVETPDLEPQQAECCQDTRPWSEIPIIEMLPAEYRAEAQVILDHNPSAGRILEACKAGCFDCWTAMERLNIAL